MTVQICRGQESSGHFSTKAGSHGCSDSLWNELPGQKEVLHKDLAARSSAIEQLQVKNKASPSPESCPPWTLTVSGTAKTRDMDDF